MTCRARLPYANSTAACEPAIEDLLQQHADNLQSHGLTAVGIGVADQGTTHVVVSGWRNNLRRTPAEPDDAWHIGSVTKAFTATLLVKLLCERGEAEPLRCSLGRIAPDLAIHPDWRACPVHALLDHTAGLNANFPLRISQLHPSAPAEIRQQRRTWVERALHKPPRRAFGDRFRYSNLGYTVAGLLIETLSDQFYDDAMRDQLAAPLGLTELGYGPPTGASLEDGISGHQILLGWRRIKNPLAGIADNTPLITPAGRLHMPLADLLRFARAHLQQNVAFMPGSAWQALHRANLQDYACGWIRHSPDWAAGPMLWHNGSNTFWYTVLMLLPQREIALAFTTNQGSIFKAERLFFRSAAALAIELTRR